MARRYARIAVTTLLMVGACSVGPLARRSEGATATGIAHFTFDDGTLRTVSFDARRRDDSTVGRIDIQDRVPIPNQDVDGTGDPDLAGAPNGVTLHAQVDCFAIEGTAAVLGGQVTSADVTRYIGKYVLLFVEDRGRAQARVSWGFYESGDDVSCDKFPRASYAPVEITGGSVKVRP